MKQSAWRFLLASLLLATLPLNGLAATGMVACGSHHDLDTASWQQAPEAAPHHYNGAPTPHSASRTPAVNAGQAGALHDDPAPTGRVAPANDKKCNACAPCCASAALTNTVSLHVAVPEHGVDYPDFATVYPPAPVGRLYRPPRLVLA